MDLEEILLTGNRMISQRPKDPDFKNILETIGIKTTKLLHDF